MIYIRLSHAISRYNIENVRYTAAIDIIRRIDKSVATAITRRGESLNRESHHISVSMRYVNVSHWDLKEEPAESEDERKKEDSRKTDANCIRSGDLLSSLVAELQSLTNRYCEYRADTA